MPYIKEIKAREVLDSRGNPTVEVEVTLKCGINERAIVPSGASTGSYEAHELRDLDNKRYLGQGVLKAVKNVNEIIAPKLINQDVRRQKEIDYLMIGIDETDNKSRLGANAILTVSLACFKAASKYAGVDVFQYLNIDCKIPTPMMNILNGGKHAGFNIDFQEIMIVPSSKYPYKEQLRMGSEIFHHLSGVLKEKGHVTSVGDEGGFAPLLSNNEEAFTLIIEAINNAGYKLKEDVSFALDVAANEIYDKEKKLYVLKKDHLFLTSCELVDLYYLPLIEKYPIISIEDPLYEDDYEGWKYISDKLKNRINIVGDDFFVTNKKRLQKGIEEECANAILIKINQIGTISETIETINLAKENNYDVIISHRSGESEDTFIADFAVGCCAKYIKTGSLSRSERIAKYNQLLRIEEKLLEK